MDRFAIYFFYLFLVGAAVAVLMSIRYLEVEREEPRRVLRPDAVLRRRHDVHGRRLRPGPAVHRPGVDGDFDLRAGRIPAPQ